LGLTIFVVDVGQGDSTVIVGSKQGQTQRVLVIDGGPAGTGAKLRQFFSDQKLDQVDYAVLTHFDADHVGGFVTIGGNDPLFWTSKDCTKTGLFPKSAIYDHFSDTPKSKSAAEWDACTGDFAHRVRVTKGSGLGQTMDLGGGYSAKIIAGDGYVLERAEVEVAIGDYLVANKIDLEVLRVGHHGSANTSNPNFIAAAKPEVAIISVGDKQPANFKHPRCKTYETLAAKGVKYVLQTETGKPDCATPTPPPTVANGTIRIDVAGDKYRISSSSTPSNINLDCTLLGCSSGTNNPVTGPDPTCCKVCKTSQPCGDTCIAATATCTKPKGCACAGN
jgi:competence protein ComEC